MGSKPPCGSTAACPQQNCAQTKVINCWCQPEADVIRIVAGSSPNPKVGRFRKLAARCSKVCNADNPDIKAFALKVRC